MNIKETLQALADTLKEHAADAYEREKLHGHPHELARAFAAGADEEAAFAAHKIERIIRKMEREEES